MAGVKGLVSGRVQGVGFRYFVRRLAQASGLSGYVRNLRDGRVEFVVQGEVDSIDSVIEQIRTGPSHARVSDVSLEELAQDIDTSGFEIL